ncbi:hypothetical protein GCM10027261_37340 [Geodermatophilus arenarius]|uniref:DUF1440 domain-containing protein n=1 Tax=Geodermatophilus arenarius TaxID=1137990 RepID=A0ABV9LPK4_9ACTN
MTGTGPSLWTGALAGYAASRTMDAATGWFHGRQSAESRRREEEIAPGGTLVQLGRQLGGVAGRDLDDAAAGRVGLAVHRTLGVTYGVLAAALVRRGWPPLAAGPAVGAAAFVLVDEGTALPTMTAYPLVSHARGVVGHSTVGLVIGLLLWLTGRS